MNEPNLIHWVVGTILAVGGCLAVWEMFVAGWRTQWEILVDELSDYRQRYEEKTYKYDEEEHLSYLSEEYTRQLIRSLGTKKHGKPKIQNISLTDYLQQHGIVR